MTNNQRSIILISRGLHGARHAFQPWHYLFNVSSQLAQRGHRLTLITDDSAGDRLPDLPSDIVLKQLPSVVNSHWRPNPPLQQAVAGAKPDLILWHLDLYAFLRQRLTGPSGVPVVGLITDPLHSWEEVTAVGRTKLLRAGRRSVPPLAEALLPRQLLRRQVASNSSLKAIVVQTQTTARQLHRRRLWTRPLHVIAPGVDAIWHSGSYDQAASDWRLQLGWQSDHKVVLYHAQPLPYRGLERFVESFIMLHHCRPTARLLVIRHHHPDAHLGSIRELDRILALPEVKPYSHVVDEPPDQEALAVHVSAADAIAFPYQLLQTDAPLHLLQARALAKPVVTTHVGCLPELVGPGAQLPTGRYGVVPLASALDQALYGRPFAEAVVPFTRGWNEVGEEWDQLIRRY